MANVLAASNERKRVKVYELKNNDWFDRGTGFCTGRGIGDESKIYVESEDQPERLLLDTKIVKDDGYQKQQDTLIVWTESSGIDMALSFQEAEGCAAIWEFVNTVQQHLLSMAGPDDALSDGDMPDSFTHNQFSLPQPEMRNLEEILATMQQFHATIPGRDAIAKFVISEDYVRKLIPFVDMAEELESLKDLHCLCSIMKLIILLNDSQIIDHIVNENVVMGVVGALEYDPDFPNHKANHRRYLKHHSRYKEVIHIADSSITKKIHATWRLTYLKDVVLARILDDPTFGVLNSLIFFNQVDIISHLQGNPHYLDELFGIIDSPDATLKRKKDAVGFIQSCCAIAKSLQAPPRATLYNNFVQHGLLKVITFAVLSPEAPIRVAGTDILVAMIDHDPAMVRTYIFRTINENKTPLTDTLIELLLVETDLGVKAQAADAIKVLLEPQPLPTTQAQAEAQARAQAQAQDAMARQNGGDFQKLRAMPGSANAQTEQFIHHFYEHSANKLFKPLKDIEKRESLSNVTFNEVQLFNHLVEIIIYLSRTHHIRSKFYIFSEGLGSRIAQLLTAPQKHLKLTALKFFRQCVGLQDEHYNKELITKRHFGPILNIVYETMPRDNLLNSACLELFEYIKRENLKPIIRHLAEEYGPRLHEITYVDTFHTIQLRYDQMVNAQDADMTLFSNDGGVSTPPNQQHGNVNGNRGWQGIREMDADEAAYFNTSDDEDELQESRDSPTAKRLKTSPKSTTPQSNGVASSPLLKSLVDYPDDEEDDLMDTTNSSSTTPPARLTAHPILPSSTSSSPTPIPSTSSTPTLAPSPILPSETLREKRRRDQDSDDDDELGKLSSNNSNKRRNSTSSPSSTSLPNNGNLRRKKAFGSGSGGKTDSPPGAGARKGSGKRMEIHLGAAAAAAGVGGKEKQGLEQSGGQSQEGAAGEDTAMKNEGKVEVRKEIEPDPA